MMIIDELDYLADKYNLNLDGNLPVPIEVEGELLGREHILTEIFKGLDFEIGAEIGVEKGFYSACLCENIPNLELFSIDPWAIYKGYRENLTQNRMNKLYESARERLSPYNCEIIRKFSTDAVKDFENESLDFVYIDGAHDFQSVTNDIVEWSKKVRVGGIVSGHDYEEHNPRKAYICHVKYVVQAYAYAHGIKPWFIVMGDETPSWFWIKNNDN